MPSPHPAGSAAAGTSPPTSRSGGCSSRERAIRPAKAPMATGSGARAAAARTSSSPARRPAREPRAPRPPVCRRATGEGALADREPGACDEAQPPHRESRDVGELREREHRGARRVDIAGLEERDDLAPARANSATAAIAGTHADETHDHDGGAARDQRGHLAPPVRKGLGPVAQAGDGPPSRGLPTTPSRPPRRAGEGRRRASGSGSPATSRRARHRSRPRGGRRPSPAPRTRRWTSATPVDQASACEARAPERAAKIAVNPANASGASDRTKDAASPLIRPSPPGSRRGS